MDSRAPPVGRSHLLGSALDEEDPLALRLAQQAVPGGVSGDNFHRLPTRDPQAGALGTPRPGSRRHDRLGGEIHRGPPHPHQIGGRYLFDRQIAGRVEEPVRHQRVDLPGVENHGAADPLDVEFQPLGHGTVAQDDIQSIAALAAEGNMQRLGFIRGGRGLDRHPLVENLGGEAHRGHQALDHRQSLHVLGVGLGERIERWSAAGACPPRNRTLSQAIHGRSFTPSEKLVMPSACTGTVNLGFGP